MGAQAQLKPRVVILTDIGQPDLEPDDTESLVHLLCYADQLEIEGIITSTGWNCDPYPTKSAAYRDSVVEAYGADVHNLMKRSDQMAFLSLEKENGCQEMGYWPSVEYIRSRSVMGSQRAGIKVIGSDNDSEGSELIIRLADEKDERPIWVCAWGGANTLAHSVYTPSLIRIWCMQCAWIWHTALISGCAGSLPEIFCLCGMKAHGSCNAVSDRITGS